MNRSKLAGVSSFSFTRSLRGASLLRLTGVIVCLFLACLTIATALADKYKEPGPEADGEYTCSKLELLEKEKKFKATELGTLELRGRTYRSFRKDEKDNSKAKFSPFTADANGNIEWSERLTFVGSSGTIRPGRYSITDSGTPSIFLYYSDHKGGVAGMMSCLKKKEERGGAPEEPGPVQEKTPAREPSDPHANATAERPAINKAVIEWVGLLDKGDYAGSFAAASAVFRKDLTVEKWKESHAAMQKQFGELVQRGGRVTLRTRTMTTEGGKQETAYVLDVQTKFSKTMGTEHITLVKESGTWKVADYSIEAKSP